ncbi:MAG: deoxyribose-phosphate aldolase [Deltaproteobacteria bacterium]|nr:deoxyribose-phosphate aldolase [Deltaproteobacteria bacterium]
MVVRRVKDRVGGGGPAEPGGGCIGDCRKSAAECTGCGHSVAKRPDDARKIIDIGAARLGAAPSVGTVRTDLAGHIDHTLLKADASKDDFRKLCDEAKRFGFASVCVNSANVRLCKSLLSGSKVMVCAVVGFPLGAMSAEAKAFEAREAVRNGASEIDMVINIGALKSRDYAVVLDDIRKVVQAAAPARVKVILETGALTREEKIIGCTLSKTAGAAFVKTSTGFGPGGATSEDVALMRQVVGHGVEVKASGGVRTTEDADRMIQAGATRIGASASVAIVGGAAGKDAKDAKDAKAATAAKGY